MHLRALCYKNCISWKRQKCLSICEIVLPVALIILLMIIRFLVKEKNQDQKSYTTGANLQNQSFTTYGQSIPTSLNSEVIPFLVDYFRPCRDDNRLIAAYIGFFSSDSDQIHNLISTNSPTSTKLEKLDMPNFAYYDDYITSSNYMAQNVPDFEINKGLCFAIQNVSVANDDYKFTIHVNDFDDNRGDLTQQSPLTGDELLGLVDQNPDQKSYDIYRDGGFIYLQNVLTNWILQKKGVYDPSIPALSDKTIQIGLVPMSTQKYTKDTDFQFVIAGLLPLFVIIIWFIPVIRFVNSIVNQKETRIKQAMRIMGMSQAAYNFSWFIYYFIIAFSMSLLVTVFGSFSFFKGSNAFIIFLIFLSFSLAIYSIIFFLSALFSRSKTALTVTIIFYWLTNFVSDLVTNKDVLSLYKYLASIFPTIGINLVAFNLEAFQGSVTGVQFENWNADYQNYRITGFIGIMLFDFVFFYVLGWYFDNILPHEWGVKRPKCFCFTRDYWCSGKKRRNQDENTFRRGLSVLRDNNRADEEEDDEDDEKKLHPELFEDVPASLKSQEENGECMIIKKLRKTYGDGKQAVRGLNVQMYKGQIFALLGHNGAGKTTTISILNGMISATSGHAFLGRINMFKETNELRRTLGFCPQHDILFPLLNAQEHLYFYSLIRGIKDPVRRRESIQQTMEKIDLGHKRFEPSKNLSGGQKRKLSIGISLVGDSQLVLLDQPTSGMDLTARRKMWKMLQKEKQQRIIVLTTHFMDEADILGDRIGIMADGKLKCCGGSLFLKNNFGVGYKLTVVKNDGGPNEALDNFVLSSINNSVKLSDISQEVIYQLPIEESDKFANFFKQMDEQSQQLNVSEYGFAVTTLQQVFLKVGRGTDISDKQQELRKYSTVKRRSSNYDNQAVAASLKAGLDKKQIQAFQIENNNQNDQSVNATKQSTEEFSISNMRRLSACSQFCNHTRVQLQKKWRTYTRNVPTLIVQIIIPLLFVLAALLFTLVSFFFNSPSVILTPVSHYGSIQDIYTSSTINNQFFDSSQVVVKNLPTAASTLKDFDDNLLAERKNLSSEIYGSYYIVKQDTLPYQAVVLANIKDKQSVAIFTNQILEKFLRQALNNNSVNLTFTNLPFPIISKVRSRQTSASGITLALMIVIAFAIVPGAIIRQLITQKRTLVYHQQLVSGASKMAYWLANFIIDITRMMVIGVISIALIYAFSSDFKFIWLTILLYPFPTIAFSYFLSVLPLSQSAGAITSNLIHMILGTFLAITVFFLRLFPSTKDVGVGLMWTFRILPPFALADSITNSSGFQQLNKHVANSDSEYLQLNSLGGDLLFYPISFVIFTFIATLFEIGVKCQKDRDFFDKRRSSNGFFKDEFPDIDKDVEDQRLRLFQENNKNSEAVSPDEVVVMDLEKRYKKNRAVRHLNFGLNFGECFALLGVNGAGKSSTFKSLTGQTLYQNGLLKIHQLDVKKSFDTVRRYIGYCPQLDTLIPDMTVIEHLYYHAVLKNIPRRLQKALVQRQIQDTDLTEYQNKKSKQLSGGNKRKLCVAIALLGNPPIILLDEPSTGIDPKARRFMWNIISRISQKQKKSAVVLTTHSMEEAEALSTKIGIMVKGQFKCYGRAQHLKNKFSNGYEFDFKIKEPSDEQVAQIFLNIGIEQDLQVGFGNIAQILQKFGANVIISEKGAGSDMHKAIKDKGKISVKELYLWAFVEHNGNLLLNDLRSKYNVELAEHYFNFFKFRINPKGSVEEQKFQEDGDDVKGQQISLGELFGEIEERKAAYALQEYSIAQTTLEQIFHTFALQEHQED